MGVEGEAERAVRAGTLTVSSSDEDGRWVVALAGELDLATAGAAAAAVAAAAASDAEAIVIDIGALTFIDSSGLAMLLTACRSEPGRLRLTRPAGAVKRVIELTGMTDALAWAG